MLFKVFSKYIWIEVLLLGKICSYFCHYRRLAGCYLLINENSQTKLKSEGKGVNDKINKKLGSISDLNEQLSAARSKSKMGPPQRKLNSKTENLATGRVSVYCVGSAIDLDKLRAHVFRRGFGSNKQKWDDGGHDDIDASPELILTRKAEDTEIDDEVLHVSNAPVFISSLNERKKSPKNIADDREDHPLVAYEYNDNLPTQNTKSQQQGGDDIDEEYELRTKELLAMSTQDIFYFEYGCVVFWGLTTREEKGIRLYYLIP